MENVEVPAEFKAVVVQIKHENGGKKTDTMYWFVEDVGFVKHTYAIGGLNVVLELEAL